ncbi:hypothetical protein VTN00DRAFT_542 [Thermoascus crustaceus]|uniref:uncharacterized protein n=1 Tax=Thermoascus crustaceus TaxID=5088 RepID=UPI0037445E1B
MVSEEEYRYAMQILQRFLPDKELNLEVLRDTALRMEGQAMNNSPSTSAETERRQASEAIRDTPAVDHQGSPLLELARSRDPFSSGENPQGSSGTSAKDLTERIGNLMIDSTGTLRYVGREADIVFHSAIRAVVEGSTLDSGLGAYLPPMRSVSMPPPSPESQNYMKLAKSLVTRVLDEANLDSIRALSLLSLAMQNESFTVIAYLYIGLAARIAITLGLHREEAYREMDIFRRECALRVWWTLFQLDHEISRYRGRPCAIDETETHMKMPSEMALNSGIYIPFGYTQASITLSQLERWAFRKFYGPSRSGQKVSSFQQLDQLIKSLENWYVELPSHIRWDIPLAPPHRRPVCVLHLRYWSTITSLTRVYLLYNIVHGSRVPGAEERRLLNDLGRKCIDACDQSLKVLKVLRSHDLLSSLTVYDTKWLIDLAMLSILILIKQQSPQTHQNLKACVDMLQSMESRGWCKWASQELATVITSHNLRAPEMHIDATRLCSQAQPSTTTGAEFQNIFALSAEGIFDFELPPLESDFPQSEEDFQTI